MIGPPSSFERPIGRALMSDPLERQTHHLSKVRGRMDTAKQQGSLTSVRLNGYKRGGIAIIRQPKLNNQTFQAIPKLFGVACLIFSAFIAVPATAQTSEMDQLSTI